ncbi:conserved hypothetical protein [Uncinocarpus reesii 1704]|uniref:Deacetylase sirtuin-type domain-containing protein n=1 Tax=Uncinocarpus reesii (strain UAMH 1704) TaxID=336963 RepID=C4JGE9_UNCRE|nr:uncharacterized protein UREG_01140 [Uncinocarpus reesii 1704]EEP76291.1 conserved hypothetical protein [Uncinocarpus reesii 1704]
MASAPGSSVIPEADLRSFREHLKHSKRIVAVVGAGLSAASGLPTFRGVGGLWRRYSAIDLATPEAFNATPGLVWQFYGYRRHMALLAKPNRAHYALAALARKKPDFITLTQNVDGLSERAGHPEPQLQRLHGSLYTIKCANEYCTYSRDNDFTDPVVPALDIPKAAPGVSPHPKDHTGEAAGQALEDAMKVGPGWEASSGELDISNPDVPIPELTSDLLPPCPECATGLLRPGVVWFGEPLAEATLDFADKWIKEAPVDLVMVIGTSARVSPAACYIDDGREQGARVAVINMDRTHLPRTGMKAGDWVFEGDASVILPKLFEEIVGEIELPKT